MRITLRIIAFLAATAAALAVMATPAQADTTFYATDVNRGPEAGSACGESAYLIACYERYGDELFIKDKRADGHGIDFNFWWGSSDTYVCKNRLGANNGWTWCNGLHDLIAEHEYITLWAWADDDGYPVSGSGARFGSAT